MHSLHRPIESSFKLVRSRSGRGNYHLHAGLEVGVAITIMSSYPS